MKLSFRWYGEDDPVKIGYIRQIPNMYSVVTAVYDVPVGEVWSVESIEKLKKITEDNGLHFDVIESVPVHEDIKLGLPTREKFIENYKENIRRLGSAGVKVICYNFMPIFDWTRTQLDYVLPDGSTALVYFKKQLEKMDPLTGELSLPGWDASYTKKDLNDLFEKYKSVDEEKLFENLEYFLKAIIPVAEEVGVRMAVHPDDPPRPILGLPRIVSTVEDMQWMVDTVNSMANGFTMCTGSYGVRADNDLVDMIKQFGPRIYFTHLRSTLREDNPKTFH